MKLLAAWSIFSALSLFSLPAAAGMMTGNLLLNAGGETGVAAPWTFSSSTILASAPATFGSHSLAASEGSHWFRIDLNSTLTGAAAGNGVNFNGNHINQVVDVRALGQILSVTFGGDLLGVGEITSGNGTFSMGGRFAITFLDQNLVGLGGRSAGPNNFSIAMPTVIQDVRGVATTIPTGTAFIRFTASSTLQVITNDGGDVQARAIQGHDDLFLAIEHESPQPVPEPSSVFLLAVGVVSLLARRRLVRIIPGAG